MGANIIQPTWLAEDGSLYRGKPHGAFAHVLPRAGFLCLLMALLTVPGSDRSVCTARFRSRVVRTGTKGNPYFVETKVAILDATTPHKARATQVRGHSINQYIQIRI